MFGLNAVALVFFSCINVLACKLCKCDPVRRKRAITALCILLLGGNLFRYGIFNPLIRGDVRVPVEFSTIAYFAVPAILLLCRTHLRSWAAYSGLMAGFFYYLAMILVGGPLYQASAPLDIYISMLCHGTIYLCGFVCIGTEQHSARQAPVLVLGVALVALWAAAFHDLEAGRETFLIYILMDALPVRAVVPQRFLPLALPVYYGLLVSFVLLTIRGFFRRSRKQYLRFSAARV